MLYLLAFDIENSWTDEFAVNMASLLDDTADTSYLYELADRKL